MHLARGRTGLIMYFTGRESKGTWRSLHRLGELTEIELICGAVNHYRQAYCLGTARNARSRNST
eukprot:3581977-Prorocentrum_lima.AAC.1